MCPHRSRGSSHPYFILSYILSIRTEKCHVSKIYCRRSPLSGVLGAPPLSPCAMRLCECGARECVRTRFSRCFPLSRRSPTGRPPEHHSRPKIHKHTRLSLGRRCEKQVFLILDSIRMTDLAITPNKFRRKQNKEEMFSLSLRDN